MSATIFSGLSTDGVHQIAVPRGARARCMLARIDYEDAFLVDTGPARNRTAEQWARAILEGAPIAVRSALVSGWSASGLRLGSLSSEEFVLGWEVRRSTPDRVLLAARSRFGLPAELLVERRTRRLLFATFVQHENPVARALWAGVEPVHGPVVRHVLARVIGHCD
jgi:hypothetical protein